MRTHRYVQSIEEATWTGMGAKPLGRQINDLVDKVEEKGGWLVDIYPLTHCRVLLMFEEPKP